MKYAELSFLLILVLMLSFLTGTVCGYYDQNAPKGVQLPVTILAADFAAAKEDLADALSDQDDPQQEEDAEAVIPEEEVTAADAEEDPENGILEENEEPEPEIRVPRPEDSNPLLEEVYPDLLAELELAEDQFTEYSEADRAEAKELLLTADEEIFPRMAHTWDFSEAQGYVNEILEPDLIHQFYVYHGTGNDLLMSMLPAAVGSRAGNKRVNMTRWIEDEFHASYSMIRTENLPEGAGGRCWMQYDNSEQKGERYESGVILFPGDKAYVYHTVDGERTYRAVADLSGLDQDEQLKFDFIRLDGVCWVYVNGEFLFTVEDEIIGKVSFEGGSEIYKGGNRVHCEFDNFSMKYR